MQVINGLINHQMTSMVCVFELTLKAAFLRNLQAKGDMMVNAALEVFAMDNDTDELCDTLNTIARVHGPGLV